MKALYVVIREERQGKFGIEVFFGIDGCYGTSLFAYRGLCSKDHAIKVAQETAINFKIPYIGIAE